MTTLLNTRLSPTDESSLPDTAVEKLLLEGASILTAAQRDALQTALAGRDIVVCFGAGVDSTGMLVALRAAGLTPQVLSFANTGSEKSLTLAHVVAMNAVLIRWGWPTITEVVKTTLPSTGYVDLEGNCLKNETLPSLAYGMKGCSMKWKQDPQDQLLMGVKSGPNKRDAHPLWVRTQAEGRRIVKLIGYDAGPADVRRSKNLQSGDANFDYLYPLQLIGWQRTDCVRAITQALGPKLVPIKSACFFCPASKIWELYWLAGSEPELFERALILERRAMNGKHSRFDPQEWGGDWETLVRTADRFKKVQILKKDGTVGLGRSFSWNQWARANDVVDEHFHVRRERCSQFLAKAQELGGGLDNAHDARACA